MSRNPSKTEPVTSSPVTAATMPDSYSVKSTVCIPTLKERATKAHILTLQALGLSALVHLLDANRSVTGTDDLDAVIRSFCGGCRPDATDFAVAAGHALHECVEELYLIANHPDQDAIEAMRVPTEEDWDWYQRTLEKDGGQ